MSLLMSLLLLFQVVVPCPLPCPGVAQMEEVLLQLWEEVARLQELCSEQGRLLQRLRARKGPPVPGEWGLRGPQSAHLGHSHLHPGRVIPTFIPVPSGSSSGEVKGLGAGMCLEPIVVFGCHCSGTLLVLGASPGEGGRGSAAHETPRNLLVFQGFPLSGLSSPCHKHSHHSQGVWRHFPNPKMGILWPGGIGLDKAVLGNCSHPALEVPPFHLCPSRAQTTAFPGLILEFGDTGMSWAPEGADVPPTPSSPWLSSVSFLCWPRLCRGQVSSASPGVPQAQQNGAMENRAMER